MILLIVLIAFPFLIWGAYKKVRLSRASTAWPSVHGIVTASERTKLAWRTQPRVTYSYEVAGKAYSSSKVTFADAVPASETEPTLSRFPVQAPVTVHYQPEDPGVAVLEPGPNRYVNKNFRGWIIWFIAIILLNVANVGLAIWNAKDAAKESPIHTYGDGTSSSDTASAGANTPAAAGTPDIQRGNQLLREDADKGDAKCQRYVAMWYLTGTEGYTKDPVEGAKWMRKSADQGDPESQNLMAQLYAKGTGVDKNLGTAVGWLQKSAAQGEPHACFNLGSCYEKGIGGLPADKDKAIEWYRKAGTDPNAKAALVRLGALN